MKVKNQNERKPAISQAQARRLLEAAETARNWFAFDAYTNARLEHSAEDIQAMLEAAIEEIRLGE